MDFPGAGGMMRRDDFEGQEVVTGAYVLARGEVGDSLLNRDLGLGERIAVVCIATCERVEHRDKGAAGVERVHTLKIAEAFAGDAVGEVGDLISDMRTAQRRKLDELRGVIELPGVEA
jgi:hypothetical protein